MPLSLENSISQRLASLWFALTEIFRNAWHNMKPRLPIYIGCMVGLSFSVIPALSIPIALKALILISPLIFETTRSAISYLFFRPRIAPRLINSERNIFRNGADHERVLVQNIIRAAGLGNFFRARSQISQLSDPLALSNLASRIITLERTAANSLFPQTIARMMNLGYGSYLAQNENLLLRQALRQNNPDIVNRLLHVNEVMALVVENPLIVLEKLCRHGDLINLETLLDNEAVLAHVTDHNNLLLRIAQQFEHMEVIERLLLIPSVANFAYPPNFHETLSEIFPPPLLRQNATVNSVLSDSFSDDESDDNGPTLTKRSALGKIAKASEGSMSAITTRQQKALDDMEAKYKEQYTAKGLKGIFKEIKTYLRETYEREPARNARGLNLPLNCQRRYFLSLNAPYFKHIVHSAYRYLFMHPNPLSDDYPNEDELEDDDRLRIAYMWLAATDPAQKLPEGQTRESLLSEFTQSIYELCRAHNFDGKRWVEKQRKNPRTGENETIVVQEAFDDLQGDKATCGEGVTQRITQFYMVFLNDRPETRPLSPDVMRTKFQEQMVNESQLNGCLFSKLSKMDKKTLQALQAALENKFVMLEEISGPEQRLINQLSLRESEVKAFIKECDAYYGAKRISAETSAENRLRFDTHRFKSYEEMIRHLADNVVAQFYLDIDRNIKNILSTRPEDAPIESPARTLLSPQRRNHPRTRRSGLDETVVPQEQSAPSSTTRRRNGRRR